MRARFVIVAFFVTALFGVMITIVTSHVNSVADDWNRAKFGTSDHVTTLTVAPAEGQDSAETKSSTINASLRKIVAAQAVTIVLDASGSDGPRVGLYDTSGRFSSLIIEQGRRLDNSDYVRGYSTAMVNADSYLVGREALYLPKGLAVVGYYDPESAPFGSEYVYNLFTQQNVFGTYYVDSTKADLAERMATVLRAGGYSVSVSSVAPVWLTVVRDPAFIAYVLALVLVLTSLILLFSSWVQSRRRTFLIHNMYGARPLFFTGREMPPIVLGILMGALVGGFTGLGAANLVTPSQSVTAPEIIVGAAANSASLCLAYAATAFFQRARWALR